MKFRLSTGDIISWMEKFSFLVDFCANSDKIRVSLREEKSMLYVALVISSLVLLTIWWTEKRERSTAGALLGCGCLANVVAAVVVVLTPVAWQFLLLSIGYFWWKKFRSESTSFTKYAIWLTAAAFAIAAWGPIFNQITYVKLRQKYPLQSFDNRLPESQSTQTRINMTLPIEERLKALEKYQERYARRSMWKNRNVALERLHQGSLELFVNSFGFGISRMSGYYSNLDGMIEHTIRYQPQSISSFKVEGDSTNSDIDDFHFSMERNFLNPERYGYAKDRQHVAGFLHHMVDGKVDAPYEWKLQGVYLVGLLMHADPCVYLSENLPTSANSTTAKRRPLDEFETKALAKIRGGEDLVVGGTPQRTRVMGSMRNAKQCILCHGGNRGDLLGAFSYFLSKKVKK